MKISTEHALAKVPEVTLGFWLIKIAATTLGETAGDALSMTLNLGYAVSTLIFFASVILVLIWYRIRTRSIGEEARELLERP